MQHASLTTPKLRAPSASKRTSPTAMIRVSFAVPRPYITAVCQRAATTARFPAWRPPSSLRASPNTRSFRLHPGKPSSFNGSGPGATGGDADASGPGELFASTPELEKLAMKSSAAPVLSRVVSYNVLSSSLAGASHFRYCDPSDLDAAVRLKRVMSKLEGPIASRSIICLQEVSLAWSGTLHTFFANRGFHLVLASYGSYFNGYMGVALAFPTDVYEPVDIRVERLSDMVKWPQKAAPEGAEKFFYNLRIRIEGAIQSMFGGQPKRRRRNSDPWLTSQDRRNMIVFARLRSKTNGALLCVGTYHMPCAFWSPPIMLIHSALVVSQFQKLCGGDPAVLAGDFNFKPGDSSYSMILDGNIDPNNADFPPPAPDGTPATKWFPTDFVPMKSAYKEILGTEPDFTNFARVEENPVFIETLDYIFCSDSVDVVDVIRLPHRDAVRGPYPVPSEPSDHVMVGATLRLVAPAARGSSTAKLQPARERSR